MILDACRDLLMLKRTCAIRDNARESRPVAAVAPGAQQASYQR
jgi:hypothetical protein